MTVYIRPMSLGELFRSFFGVYKKAFWFLTLFTLGFIVFYYYVDSYVWKAIGSVTNIAYFLSTMVDVLMPVFAIGPILIVVSNVVLSRKISLRESFGKGLSFGLLVKTLFVSIVFIIISAGIVTVFDQVYFDLKYHILYFFDFWVLDLFMMIVYILITQIWIFFPMVLVLEKKSFLAAIGRSFYFLFYGAKKLVVVDLLLVLLSAILLYPSELWLSTPTYLSASGETSTFLGYIIVIPIVTTIALVFYVLIYFETRARRENYSTDVLSEELGFDPLEEMMM